MRLFMNKLFISISALFCVLPIIAMENNNLPDARQSLLDTALSGNSNALISLVSRVRSVNFAAIETQLTPLHLAAMAGHMECVSILIQAGAKLYAKDGQGATPLHLAAENGHHDCVKLLLFAGADIKAEDENRYRPIDLAFLNEFYDIHAMLRSWNPSERRIVSAIHQ